MALQSLSYEFQPKQHFAQFEMNHREVVVFFLI